MGSERTRSGTAAGDTKVDAIVIGAGFGGLYMLHRFRQMGLSVRLLERGSDLGGTWFWNRYPGARCDIQSIEYSYQFSPELQQEWVWSEKYATQPEILRYLNHVAERFDLRGDMRFNANVERAQFDDTRGRWRISTTAGENYAARYCVAATGCLSSANQPEIAGIKDFSGAVSHRAVAPRRRRF